VRAADANVAYVPGTADIRVVPQRETGALAPRYSWFGVLAGDSDNRLPTSVAERDRMVFISFATLVVRDGIPPAAAHAAFLAIDEYRWALAPDVPGAEARPENA
jgi:hypothetical protein